MSAYVIAVHGCDDSTYVRAELEEHDAEVLRALALVVESRAQAHCQPTLSVTPWDNADSYARERATEEND